MPAPERFRFAFDSRYRSLSRWFGVSEQTAWVDLDDQRLDAHFGRWRLTTGVANIVAVEVTGPYQFYRTAGPARLGVSDLGLTFATNGARGVLLRFAERVPAIEPLGILRHGELTVTVAEVERFAAAVREAIAGRR